MYKGCRLESEADGDIDARTLFALSIVSVIYSGTVSPNGGHKRGSTGSFRLRSRCRGNEGPTIQPSQQALRLQPIRFQLSVHFKGMLASLRAEPPHTPGLCRQPSGGDLPQFHDRHKRGDASLSPNLPADTPTRQAVKKNIRCHCPIFCFTPRHRGPGCSRSKPFPPDSHMGLTVL